MTVAAASASALSTLPSASSRLGPSTRAGPSARGQSWEEESKDVGESSEGGSRIKWRMTSQRRRRARRRTEDDVLEAN